MDSTSSSVTASPSTQGWTYDVFLSFRGPDTRNTFVDYLYSCLVRRGIRTFKDEERLEKGDCISESLQKAIQESQFFIAVFSKDYASSKWCLEELATSMEFNKQTVVPIFYHVEPSDVRNQKGSFEDSFKKLENVFKDKEETVRRWKEALKNTGSLKGYHLHKGYNNGQEATWAEEVAAYIHARLNQASLAFEENLVGLESRVNNIINWLRLASDDDDADADADARFIGICGMGGIGKTTIAMVVFNRFSHQFDGSCFLADVRQQHNVIELQKTLLTEVLKEKSRVQIINVHDGRMKIKTRFKGKKVLIVLDDVDDPLKQLDELAGGRDWFSRGSRVIITTRNAGVLRSHGVDENYIYQVDTLEEQVEAIQLFSLYAFKTKIPKTGFEKLCESIVPYAMGLPLALKVLGSHLCGLKADNWENILEKLKDSDSVDTLKNKILKVLRIGFDGLDPNDQNVFLHIACFLRNWREEVVKDVVDSNLLVLIEKSLISVQNGEIEMHDRIQEMGWHIASEENPRKMVWQLKDANDVLSRNMEQIEGIQLPYPQPDENNTFEITLRGMRTLKILKVHSSIVFRISDKYLPSSLRWLEFESYHFDSLPESFASRKLCCLSLQKSSLQSCRITQKLDKLTLLDLRNSESLLKTPDFDFMPNLKRLYLSYCKNLKVVYPSIGNLRKLENLDLSECCNLVSLPSFNHVSSLNSLDLCGCIKLKEFPEIKERMPHLVKLYLSEVRIKELPSSIQQLHGLTELHLERCEHLVCLSHSFCELKNLKVVVINYCRNLKSLPENLQGLISLEYLNLNESYIDSFPESFNQLPRLQHLDIRNCENLKKLPKLPETTCQLYADSCFSYRRHIDELVDFPELQSVAFSSSFKRTEYDFAEMCNHFPSHRKTPFSVTYPIDYDYFSEVNVLRIFQYQCYNSNGISIDLNPGWNCQSFVGFAVCFLAESYTTWRVGDIADVNHCTIIVKLSCKDNKNEVLPRKCVIVKSSYDELQDENEDSLCFAYIPFSALSTAKSNSVTSNDFSRFEVNFMDWEAIDNWGFNEPKATANWGCSLLYDRSERPESWNDSCEGCTTDIGPLDMLKYLNLNGKKFKHLLPEDISRLRCVQYLDIHGCEGIIELSELPATIRELYAPYNKSLASENNIVELATKYSELYSLSFSEPTEYYKISLVPGKLAKKFIHITQPFLNRNTPFAVTYPLHPFIDYEISGCFKYLHHDTHHDAQKISISLDSTWYSHNFVGFVVCFMFPNKLVRWESHHIHPFRHCKLITKLTHKDHGSETPLETKCMIGRPCDDELFGYHKELVCFAYIPFSSLWPKSKTITDHITPNHYLVFEASIQCLGLQEEEEKEEYRCLEFSTYWSCGLLYTNDESLIEAIWPKREVSSFNRMAGSSVSDLGAAMTKTKKRTHGSLSQKLATMCTSNPASGSGIGSRSNEEEEEEDEEENNGSQQTEDSGGDDAMPENSNPAVAMAKTKERTHGSLSRKLATMCISNPASSSGCTTDIGTLGMFEYLNLSSIEHLLPEDISRFHRLQILDINGCSGIIELPKLPATIRELYAPYNKSLASESNIAELATKYSELYSVSFSYPIHKRNKANLVPRELAKKFIPITQPFLNRNTPFAVTYPFYTTDWSDHHYISSCFKYPHHDPHHNPCKISISLDPTWYSHKFVGFVVCFLLRGVRWESHLDILPFEHCELITKLTRKDHGSEPPLQTKCVIGRPYEEFDMSDDADIVCFAYIPFSSLWSKCKTITDNITPNHYLVFEAAIQKLNFSEICPNSHRYIPYWSCGLLYTDDESLTEAIWRIREVVSSESTDSGIGSKTKEEREEKEGEEGDGEEYGGSKHTTDGGGDDAIMAEENSNNSGKEGEDEEMGDEERSHQLEQRKKARLDKGKAPVI